MLLILNILMVLLFRCHGLASNNCAFNSMCICSADQNDPNAKTIHGVSCLTVPFYKFPSLPEYSIGQLEVVGTKTAVLESESLTAFQVQALILTNNQLQHVADRAFSSQWKSLTSLDLSYNQLDNIPFLALKELRNLQWINLHGNQIASVNGAWSHMKNTIATLFLGENDLTEISTETANHNPKNSHTLQQFKSLIWLNLDGNRIHKIHERSLPLTLKTISISHNLLDRFPLELINSVHLQWLYLRGNHIETLPRYTSSRKLWLEKIDLGENYLEALPRHPFNKSVCIRDFNLAHNDFKTVTADSFSGLNTGKIIFSHNLLETMEESAFNGIVRTLEYLDLDHNNLERIPNALDDLESLKYLYLSSNYLTEIPDNSFQNFCHTLKALSLSGNYFTKIPSNALQNCSKISHFNIAFNKIYEIDENDFVSWGDNIKSLILANNRITNLKDKVFSGLQELKELSLSFNPLRQIDKDTFVGLESLESLEISFGFDSDDLSHEIFAPLANLKWLSIDNNNFNILSPQAFETLPELKYLNLESNRIQSIPVMLLKSSVHSRLRDVRFSNNELTLIESSTFRSMDSLETILLSNNRIKHLQSESFVDLPSLNKLMLSDNFLTSIKHNTFRNLPSIMKIDLHNNLLVDFSFKIFTNVSGPLQLNLSRNFISSCQSDSTIMRVEIIDLRYNNLDRVPKCLEHTSSLRKLYLDFNIISFLDQSVFMFLTSLEYLSLQQNNVKTLNKRAFLGLQNLQFLDLSKNLINQVHVSQFSNMSKLRLLNLSGNILNYLSKDIFKNTSLEMLDLSYNSFSVVPSSSVSDVGYTLRYLSLGCNNIEHIDITTFPDIPSLQHMDLSNNKLTILPDNVFTSLGLLQTLDLSSNPLRSNFKELFHYAQSLKHLNLAYSGIKSTPHFPLPNLVHLNLSHNQIEVISRNSVQFLFKLRLLDLSYNSLFSVPSHLWSYLPLLKILDLSHNPIKELLADSFHGLTNLQELNVQYLNSLNRFESTSILQLRIISKLSMQTWPRIDGFSKEFCHLLSRLTQLRKLRISVVDSVLDDQLQCLTNRKIRHLEVTGANLKFIEKDAFSGFRRNPELTIKIHGTKIEELPSGLFSNMYRISHLAIDLRYNALTHLHPEVFYGNLSRWNDVGTTLISGGLFISGNPFRCGCQLSWLSHWLRRWARESVQSHNTPVETALRIDAAIKEASCIDVATGMRVPIVELEPDDMSCHASALSDSAQSNDISVIFVTLLFAVEFLR
ncbi:unnamed protein product [Phaedon cochleariae]|uniref:Disease resistance R13L4/SHOC-2-like LRR domain-containing protein n=1 Tax=Phaedon cochleariae TaxID=80249 RepID=A0A9N9X2U7_PHACE|nr:unnamed protein product [Phaedon cochleariae]